MALVVDAGICVWWGLGDGPPGGVAGEDGDWARAAAELALERLRLEEAVVPAVWWFEVRDLLMAGDREGRVAAADGAVVLRCLGRLRVRVDPFPEERVVIRLAREHGLTVFQASYLEVAMREDLDLGTVDVALVRAGRRELVRVVGRE